MLTVTLGEKEYTVEYVTALALREIRGPLEILARNSKEQSDPAQYERDLDTMVKWFCLVFRNQFTPEEVYALYPADRLLHDITLAVIAVQNNISQALKSFPTKAAAEDKKTTDA